MKNQEWLTINFTLPKEPSRVRVSVWRKLKKSGAAVVGQSVWVLPVDEKYLYFMRGIADEIVQNGGEAYVMRAVLVDGNDPDAITKVFCRERDEEYQEFLGKCEDFFYELEKETKKENFTFAELEENEEEYQNLTAWYQKIADRDFFGASLRQLSEQELERCKERLEAFSQEIYKRNNFTEK
jgi:hypothetical protein